MRCGVSTTVLMHQNLLPLIPLNSWSRHWHKSLAMLIVTCLLTLVRLLYLTACIQPLPGKAVNIPNAISNLSISTKSVDHILFFSSSDLQASCNNDLQIKHKHLESKWILYYQ